MPILDNWNLAEAYGNYKEIINRTNNGLERYNRHYNELFAKGQPSLIEFIQTLEEESCYQAARLEAIRKNKKAPPTYQGVTIPEIPDGYKDSKRGKKRKACRKA